MFKLIILLILFFPILIAGFIWITGYLWGYQVASKKIIREYSEKMNYIQKKLEELEKK